MAAQNMRDIRRKINATKKTLDITYAMHMVSASKLKRAEHRIRGYQDFLKTVKNTIMRVLQSNPNLTHTMLTTRPIKKTAYVLVTSDRGLNGAYNHNLYRQFEMDIAKKHETGAEYVIGVLGQKGFYDLQRKGFSLLHDRPFYVRDDIQFIDFIELIEPLILMYIKGEIDELVIYYNKFINTIRQDVTAERILPIVDIIPGKEYPSIEYLFEPSPQAVLDALLPQYIQNQIYGIILNAKVSEHAARMVAMQNASDNAEELIETLTLHYNRARQASITQEITEVVSGASALK